MSSLTDLTLEENPISMDRGVYLKNILTTLPNLKSLDFKQLTSHLQDISLGQLSIEESNKKLLILDQRKTANSTSENGWLSEIQNKMNGQRQHQRNISRDQKQALLPEEVITIISEQFKREVQRIQVQLFCETTSLILGFHRGFKLRELQIKENYIVKVYCRVGMQKLKKETLFISTETPSKSYLVKRTSKKLLKQYIFFSFRSNSLRLLRNLD